jgi:hypothetical protein
MIDIIIALTLAGLTAVWRFADGSDKRMKGSNILGLGIVLLAGVWAAWPVGIDRHTLGILGLVLVTSYLMVRGMPGWTEWKPMLIGFALPTALASLVYSIATSQLHGQYPSIVGAIAFGASGLAVAVCYVLLSRIEFRLGSLPGPM